jgi:hypothetical protein
MLADLLGRVLGAWVVKAVVAIDKDAALVLCRGNHSVSSRDGLIGNKKGSRQAKSPIETFAEEKAFGKLPRHLLDAGDDFVEESGTDIQRGASWKLFQDVNNLGGLSLAATNSPNQDADGTVHSEAQRVGRDPGSRIICQENSVWMLLHQGKCRLFAQVEGQCLDKGQKRGLRGNTNWHALKPARQLQSLRPVAGYFIPHLRGNQDGRKVLQQVQAIQLMQVDKGTGVTDNSLSLLTPPHVDPTLHPGG